MLLLRDSVNQVLLEAIMNMSKKISPYFLCFAIALPVMPVHAEDIDIYTRPDTTTSNPNLNPNVLIVLDNSSNWASANQHWPDGIKQGESELNALRTRSGRKVPSIGDFAKAAAMRLACGVVMRW